MYLQNLKDTRGIYKEALSIQQDMRVVKKGYLHVPQIGKKLSPAECADLQSEIDRLYNERRDLYFEYKILHDKILYGKNPGSYRKELDSKIESINKAQDAIDELHGYFEALDEFNARPQLDADISAEKKRLASAKDPAAFVRSTKRLHALQSELNRSPAPVDYIVYKIPQVYGVRDAERVAVREEPLAKPKKGKPALSDSNVKAIKENIKELIKDKLKPKNAEECASQKRSQPYYTKKDEILEVIDKHPQIKQALPANYKSLNKEDLCKHLYPA